MQLNQKLTQFYLQYCCPAQSWVDCIVSISRSKKAKINPPSEHNFMRNELKNYKQLSLTNNKATKQYGFMKKFPIISQIIPYAPSYRPEQIDVNLLYQFIAQIYDSCCSFLKMGWWKTQCENPILQPLTIFYLYYKYLENDFPLKNNFNKFYKFLLSVFFTLNTLKTHNRFLRNFYNFVTHTYTVGQFLLYLCLRNTSIIQNGQQFISSQVLQTVTQIFQEENENLSISCSLDLTHEKQIDISYIFQEPLQGHFFIPRFKLFKIMIICKLIPKDKQEKTFTNWKSFLTNYFDCLENQDRQIIFEHIVSAKVAELTCELSEKLFSDSEQKEKFLQDSFSYLFEILELVFCDEVPEICDKKSLESIMELRTHFDYIKRLNDYSMVVVTKFVRKLLKNGHILGLFKKNNQA